MSTAVGARDRVHQHLYAELMDAAGLDASYLAYLDDVPADALASINLMSMFGLHRELRGAAVGHFASTEITSSPGSRRLVDALRRLGAPRTVRVVLLRTHRGRRRARTGGAHRRRRRSGCARTTFGGRRRVRDQGTRPCRRPPRRPPDGMLEGRSLVATTTAELTRFVARTAPVAGVAHRIILAAAAGTDRDHEPVGFHDIAVGQFDTHRTLHHHRPRRRRCAPCAPAYRSRSFRPDHHKLFFAPTRLQPAGVLQPGSPRRQHGTERNPLVGNYFRIESGVRPAPQVFGAAPRTPIAPTRKCRREPADRAPPRTAGPERGGRRSRHPMRAPTRRCPAESVHMARRDRAGRTAGCRPPGRTGRTPPHAPMTPGGRPRRRLRSRRSSARTGRIANTHRTP